MFSDIHSREAAKSLKGTGGTVRCG